ncbi:MAG: glycosyl hydrolase family 65 protein, partial [Longimicrobiales bacterium]
PVCRSRPDEETTCLEMITNQSQIRVVEASRVRVFRNREKIAPQREPIEEDALIGWEFDVEMEEEDVVTLEKMVSLFTSRDHAVSSPRIDACNLVRRIDSYEAHLREHVLAWGRLWRDSRLSVVKDQYTERALNLYLFHLFQTTSKNTQDLDVGVPARGLHGEAYRGHIFWDELFVFPILNYRIPELTRSLILYRYRRLREARAAAREEGYRGAMFPWQSGSNGREETQTWHLNPKSGRWLPDNSHLQRHVNVAIPFNVWQYYEITGDLEFMASYGAELILECARFWASLATYNEALQRYEILGVMSPDEYHEAYPDADEPGLNNPAYNNVMVAWVLCRALKVLDLLPGDRKEDLLDILHLTRAEMEEWDRISRRLKIPFHLAQVENGAGEWEADGQIISQFDGYEELEEFDWEGYREKYDDIQRLDRILEAEGKSPNRYKVSKQADVLMLFYLLSAEELEYLFERLGYDWDPEIIPRTIHYYTNRTSHGSTLSGVVHAWVLARSDRKRSWSFFRRALESDLSDIQGGTTPEGIHLGAMAGTVDLIQRAYSGLEARKNVLRFNPCLPEDLGRAAFTIQYRRSWLEVEVDQDSMEISALPTAAEPIQVAVDGDLRTLSPGSTETFEL